MSLLGFFPQDGSGDYVPGPDGRQYGDLQPSERMDVIVAYYESVRRADGERKQRLQQEAEVIAALLDKAERTRRMERVLAERPLDFAYLAQAVRVAYRRRIERAKQAALSP